MKPTYVLLALLFCLIQATYGQKVSIDTLMFFADKLSSDEMEGRLPGTEGYERAVRFCASQFHRYQLSAFAQIPDFLQLVPIEHNRITGPCDFYLIHPQKGKLTFVHGEDYTLRGFTGGGKHELELAFVGYGIDTIGYNDYEGIDVRNKAVVMFKGRPNIKGLNLPNYSLSKRADIAMKHGAKAILLIPEFTEKRNRPIGSVMCARGKDYGDFPLIEIGNRVVNELFASTGKTIETIQKQINETAKPYSIILPLKAHIHIGHQYFAEVKVPNIVAYKPGTDETLKNEYVIVTAHLDHIGKHCDVIYSGANDNASGSAAVLELARVFAQTPTKRSIIFALLTSEEQGLLGARYLAQNLPVKPEQVVAALNFDCIAVGDSIQLGNGKSSPQLFELAKKLEKSNLLVSSTWAGGGADLGPFHDLKIPGLYFVSKYSYTHLHLPTDKTSTFNKNVFKNIVELGYSVLEAVANNQYQRENVQ